MHRGALRVAWGLGALLLLAACSDTAGKGSSNASLSRPQPARVQVVGAEQQPSVVYTASLVISVGDITSALDRATRQVTDAGGTLFSQRSDLDGASDAVVVYKVPPKRFQPTLARLGHGGRVLQRNVRAEDVTDQVVDLTGRLESTQASADRLRGLLDGATDTSEIVTIERELAKREAEVESLAGRLRVLNDDVARSTITVRFTERKELTVSKDVPGFLRSFRAGGVAVVNVLLVVAAAVGFLLPFLPFALVGWWLVRRYRRRNPPRPRPPRRPPPGGPNAWPGPVPPQPATTASAPSPSAR